MLCAMSTPPMPMCAICAKPVERLERYDDPCTLDIVFSVHCHGEREDARVSYADQMSAVDGALQLGDAFQTQAKGALCPAR